MDTPSAYDPNDPRLTVKDAARQLGVNVSTVRRWIQKGAIRYLEVGPFRRKKLLQSEVDRQLRRAGAA